MKRMIYPIMLMLLSLAVSALPCTDGMTATIAGGFPSFECSFDRCESLGVVISIDPHQNQTTTIQEYDTHGCSATLPSTATFFPDNITYICSCTDGYIFNLTASPNSNGTYHIKFIQNYTIITPDAPSDGGSSGGGGGGGGSASPVNDSYIKAHGGSILMYQFCIDYRQKYEFYAKNDGKVIIMHDGYEGNTTILKAISDYGTSYIKLSLYENATADLLNPNGAKDSLVRYYQVSQTTQKPCFRIYQIVEGKIPEPKADGGAGDMEIIEDESWDNVKSEPEYKSSEKKKSYLWIVILVIVIVIGGYIWHKRGKKNAGEKGG